MPDSLKQEVHDFWNEKACGTWEIDKQKFTKEYFEEIEEYRYALQPEIFAFAQFPLFHGKKVLEIGIGAATDFLQWCRSGAEAYGIDLTEEAVRHAQHRLGLYGLEAKHISVGDCENLEFDDCTFDLVYSWGVIHHTPGTLKALSEAIRVAKHGGKGKIMIYNRHSILAWFFWVKHALLKFRPWRSVADVLFHHMESLGTKAYTIREIERELEKYDLASSKVSSIYCYYDRMERFSKPLRCLSKFVANLLGRERVGWFLTIEFTKK